MAVLRQTLQSQLARPFQGQLETFIWGMVRCLPDYHTGAPTVTVNYEIGAGNHPVS